MVLVENRVLEKETEHKIIEAEHHDITTNITEILFTERYTKMASMWEI